jgi:putative MATE family efflux protein
MSAAGQGPVPGGPAAPPVKPPSTDIQRIKDGPILSTLMRLAVPNVLAMLMTVLVAIAETFYVGLLGTTQLAAMALVFPFVMLMQQMSAGAMGGGVSSAISRALGESNEERAQTLAFHALVIGLVAGVFASLFFLAFGPALYRLLGGKDLVLEVAIRYSTTFFCGVVLIWLMNTMASILRGTGNMRIPSLGIFGAAALQIVLSGILGLGLGPVPRLGMTGIALGQLLAMGAGVAFFGWYLLGGKGRLTLRLRGIAMHREMFHDILKVGALACLSPLQSVLTMQIFTGLIAHLGMLPLAGYSIGQRLEFLLVPISFGIGVASVPMVGMAIGAGRIERARRVAWTAGLVSMLNLAVIGLVVAISPDLWAGLFTSDEQVLEVARQYLRIAGPAFPFFGLGLTLYFASQGSGKMLGPVAAALVRPLLVAGVGGWMVTQGLGAQSYFGLVAGSLVAYGLATALAVRLTRWGRRG